jgi:hypothetical protein
VGRDDPPEHLVGPRAHRELDQPAGVSGGHRALVDDAVQQQRPERVVVVQHRERSDPAAAGEQGGCRVRAQRGPQPVHRELARRPKRDAPLDVELEDAVGARVAAHVAAMPARTPRPDAQEPDLGQHDVQARHVARADEHVNVAARVRDRRLAAQ